MFSICNIFTPWLSNQSTHTKLKEKNVKLHQLINLQNKNSEVKDHYFENLKGKVKHNESGFSKNKSNPLKYKIPQNIKSKFICFIQPQESFSKEEIFKC